jgi:hypothetical protein
MHIARKDNYVIIYVHTYIMYYMYVLIILYIRIDYECNPVRTLRTRKCHFNRKYKKI